MSFDADIITTATVVKIEFPARTVRICDGGFLVFDSEVYNSDDSVFGTLAAGDAITEGEGDSSPAISLIFYPKDNAAASDLASPNMQGSPIEVHQVLIDGNTGSVVDSEALFFGFVDVPRVTIGRTSREVELTIVSDSERLFMIYEGNRMSEENHKRRFPNERGHDNMTGVESEVAWGTETKPSSRGSSTGSVIAAAGGLASFLGKKIF